MGSCRQMVRSALFGSGRPRGSLSFRSVLCWPHASGLSLGLGPSCRSGSSFPGQGAWRSQRSVEVRVREVPSVGFPFLGLSAFRLGSAESAVFLLSNWSVKRRVLSFAFIGPGEGCLAPLGCPGRPIFLGFSSGLWRFCLGNPRLPSL